MRSLVLLVLVAVLAHAMDENMDLEEVDKLEFPAVKCHESLCHLNQGFYVENEGVTRVWLHHDSELWDELCVFVDSKTEAFCFETSAGEIISQIVKDIWVDIPLKLSGRHQLSTRHSSFNESSISSDKFEYFIQHVTTFPESANFWTEITYPNYGAIIDTRRLLIKLKPSIFMAHSKMKQLTRLFQVRDFVYDWSVDTLDTLNKTEIEPGSYFVEVSPFSSEKESSVVSSAGYMEHVLSPEKIKENRRFYSPPSQYEESIPSQTHKKTLIKMTIGEGPTAEELNMPPSAAVTRDVSVKRKKNICLWTSDTMDGQKNIWLQQMLAMNRDVYDFTCFLSPRRTETSTGIPLTLSGRSVVVSPNGFAMKVLNKKLADIALNPSSFYPIQVDSLNEVPGDGSPPFSEVWDGTEGGVKKYVVERLELYYGREVEITPLWTRKFVWLMLNFVKQYDCDIMVYGNDREDNADALIVSLGYALNIPTVAELLNLFVGAVPSVIIGPSHYAIEHPTVIHANQTDGYQGIGRPKTAEIQVISPGVDLKLFNPDAYLGKGNYRVQKFHNVSLMTSSKSPFIIGYVGRLSIEKNIGLFLLAADRILKWCFHCRFTVIGDGALRSKLELLSAQLDISWAIHFAGWQSESSLPSVLAGVDVVINPSLRAWSETFCIVNIEVMAMRIPLVTFAVGGVGEYVRDPQSIESKESTASRLYSQLGSSDDAALFSVGSNAIVLNVATPEAIEQAINLLLHHPDIGLSLGLAGRKVVEKYFTLDRQIQEYDRLYSRLTRSN